MSKRIVLAGLVPAVLAVSAIADLAAAADLGPYGPRQQWRDPQPAYYPLAFRWTGFYAGIQAGYGWGGTDAVSPVPGTGLIEAFSYSTSGAVGGVHAGYNWQSGAFVFGLETDIEASGISGSSYGTLGNTHTTNIDWLGSMRGRLGYATGNTLFYVTGGLAYGGVSIDRALGAGLVSVTGTSDWQTGWTLGGGIEHAFSPNVSVRVEYRYTDLGQIEWTTPGVGITDSSDVTQSALRAGLSFRF